MSAQLQFAPVVPANVTVPSGMPLRLTMLGAMDARNRTNGSVLPLGRKTRALLAILALAAPRPVPRAKLAELLWSRRLEEQARASLRQEIHRLLDALHPVDAEIIRVTRDHLSLRREATWVDVQDVLAATPDNMDALGLLDGELLAGFDGLDPMFDTWLAAERDRLRHHAREVAQARLATCRTPEEVLPTAQLLVKIDRVHEGAWRAIMRIHAERGERGLAVQAYERCRTALADVMDARPAPETQLLVAEIRAGTLSSPSAPAASMPSPRPAVVASAAVASSRQTVRLAVPPLRLIGCGPEEEALAVGLAEEMAGALARFRWLSLVLAPAAKNGGAGPGEEGPPLDFRLDGTIQRIGSRLRIGVRLTDLRADDQIVWGRHFDSGTDDMLRMQDDVAAAVVAQLESELCLAEARRSALLPSEAASAHQLVLQAYALIARMQRRDLDGADAFLTRAVALQPDQASVHAARAYWHIAMCSQGWSDDPSRAAQAAGECAERAIVLDPHDARALTIAGQVRACLFQRPREAVALHAQALAVNPFLGMAWGYSALNHIYLGELDEAERRLARYHSLVPDDRDAFIVDAAAIRLEIARHSFTTAVQYGRRVTELNPFYLAGLANHLAALGHAGQLDEAAVIRRRLLAADPAYCVQAAYRRSPYVMRAMVDHYAEGLRLAGLPEVDEVRVA